MKRINIGVDIDGTLTKPDFFVKTMSEYFKKKIDYDNNRIYDWLEAYDLERNEFDRFYKVLGPDMHFEAEIRDGARQVIRSFSHVHNIFYLTARQKWLESITAKWLEKHQLPGKYYVIGTHNKLPFVNKLKCDLFIEDNNDVANSLAKAGIKVILLNCPYNIDKKVEDSVLRVDNWLEIKEFVTEYAGN